MATTCPNRISSICQSPDISMDDQQQAAATFKWLGLDMHPTSFSELSVRSISYLLWRVTAWVISVANSKRRVLPEANQAGACPCLCHLAIVDCLRRKLGAVFGQVRHAIISQSSKSKGLGVVPSHGEWSACSIFCTHSSCRRRVQTQFCSLASPGPAWQHACFSRGVPQCMQMGPLQANGVGKLNSGAARAMSMR